MRMSVNPKSITDGRIELILEHAGEQMNWRVTPFNKKVFVEDVDVCEHINAYWASLAVSQQQLIYETYKQIYDIFDTVYEPLPMMSELRPLIRQLYEYHNLDDVERWMAFHGQNIHIPSSLHEHYVHSDERPGNRNKTYTRGDYIKLVGLALILRPMIPVWGEFIERTQKDTGTPFKEYYAYQLLALTRLNESPAMEKLKIYIRELIPNDENSNPTLIVDGVGTEDYDLWLLGALLVTRICVGDIRGSDSSTPSLVITSYKYISGRISGSNGNAGSSFGEQIRAKDFKTTSGSDDQEVSQIEAYKIKQALPIGDIAPFEHFLSNPEYVAKLVYPEIDIPLLHTFIDQTKRLMKEKIWPCQITLAQWVLSRVMSGRALQYLDKPTTLRAIAIAQTVLWQRGHKELAALITCAATSNTSTQQYSGAGSMARITRDLNDEISALYPYQRIGANRTKTKPANAGIQAIDSMAALFNTRDWLLMLPEHLAVELVGSSNNRRYPCPHGIKTYLARLVVEVATRKLA